MDSDLAFSSMLDQYKKVEEKITATTQEHPLLMVGVATGLGMIIGMMGLSKTVQLGVALSVQDKFSMKTVKDLFDKATGASHRITPSAHA